MTDEWGIQSEINLLLKPGHVNLHETLKIIFTTSCSKAQGWPAYYLAIMFTLARQISIILSTFNPNLWLMLYNTNIYSLFNKI